MDARMLHSATCAAKPGPNRPGFIFIGVDLPHCVLAARIRQKLLIQGSPAKKKAIWPFFRDDPMVFCHEQWHFTYLIVKPSHL
jgi:hypothetical protein